MVESEWALNPVTGSQRGICETKGKGHVKMETDNRGDEPKIIWSQQKLVGAGRILP